MSTLDGAGTKIALVADLHGNLPAVEALNRDLNRRNIRHIFCLGDLVGKGPSNVETMDWALNNCEVIIRGNWDEGIALKQYPGDEYYYRQLGEQRLRKLMDLPSEHHLSLSGRKIRLFHGRPTMNEPYFIHAESAYLEPFFKPDWDVVGYADVHRQGLRVIAFAGLLFNTGSVGNGLGIPMVQYAILDGGPSKTDALDIQFVTLPYDREQAVQDTLAAKAKGLPHADDFINEIKTGRYSRKSEKKYPI